MTVYTRVNPPSNKPYIYIGVNIRRVFIGRRSKVFFFVFWGALMLKRKRGMEQLFWPGLPARLFLYQGGKIHQEYITWIYWWLGEAGHVGGF